MADLIENPIINSPFEEPKRYFRFTDDGITDEIVIGRRCIQLCSKDVVSDD